MNILITGGAGYMGTELVKELMLKKVVQKIIIYDNLSRANYNFFLGKSIPLDSRVQYLNGDILDSRKLKKALKGIDVVYHLAARVTNPLENVDGHFYEQVNHWGTAEMVYAIEESDVSKFIFASSNSVYDAAKEAATEDTEPNPVTLYGVSKMRGEEHVKRLYDKTNTYILRCGNVYGYSKSMRFDTVINRFMFEANFNRRISIHGNGKQYRSFVHIDNLAKTMSNLSGINIPSDTYNYVEKNLNILDIVDVLKEIYPDLEFIFINQHLGLRELKMSTDLKLAKHLELPKDRSLRDQLLEFKERFSF